MPGWTGLFWGNPEAILGTLRLQDGSYVTPDEETLAYLMEAHFPSFNKSGKEESISNPNIRARR